MNRTRQDADAQLDASLQRIRGALADNRRHYAAIVEQVRTAADAEVAERVARIAERQQRRIEQRERRRQQRLERHRDSADLPRGVVSAAVAVVCLVIAVLNPGLFWLVFVASGFGMSAAAAFGRAARARREQREQPRVESGTEAATGETTQAKAGETVPPLAPAPAEPPDPRVVRIQALCDKLLAELESGPPVVREVVTEPQATIGGLRQACIEIARRERELRSALAAQEETTLIAERDALAARLSGEQDQIVRDRLGQALRALEQQLAHRSELATAASRLEAENTRILYTLESLHMQLLRARSTDIGAPELGGRLRESLRELGTQIDAVAEALEWASAPAADPAGPAAADIPRRETDATASATDAQATEAQRAERLAAARRAARARDARRR